MSIIDKTHAALADALKEQDTVLIQWYVGLAVQSATLKHTRALLRPPLRLDIDPARSWAEFCEATAGWTADELKAEARKLRDR